MHLLARFFTCGGAFMQISSLIGWLGPGLWVTSGDPGKSAAWGHSHSRWRPERGAVLRNAGERGHARSERGRRNRRGRRIRTDGRSHRGSLGSVRFHRCVEITYPARSSRGAQIRSQWWGCGWPSSWTVERAAEWGRNALQVQRLLRARPRSGRGKVRVLKRGEERRTPAALLRLFEMPVAESRAVRRPRSVCYPFVGAVSARVAPPHVLEALWFRCSADLRTSVQHVRGILLFNHVALPRGALDAS